MDMPTAPISFWQAFRLSGTVKRAAKVALVVGTLLVALNHGDHIWIENWPPLWKVVLTYMVPYSVSSYSTAAFIRSLVQPRSPIKVFEPKPGNS